MNKKAFLKRINYSYGDEFKIIPLSDIHFGCAQCDVAALKKQLSQADDKTFFIGIGDAFDALCVTDKRYSKSGDIMKGEEVIDEQVEELYKILSPYKEKFIGLLCGNHEFTIIKNCGSNPVKRLCTLMEVPYLGYSCFFKLIFSENGSRVRTVNFYAHHGFGTSRTQGGNLTRFSKLMLNFLADVYLVGHSHQMQSDSSPYLTIQGDKLVSRNRYLCICGTYRKSLMNDNSVTFEERCGFPPTQIGSLTITIKPDSQWATIKISD